MYLEIKNKNSQYDKINKLFEQLFNRECEIGIRCN